MAFADSPRALAQRLRAIPDVWESLAGVGTSSAAKAPTKKRIRICNQAALVAILAFLPYANVFLWRGFVTFFVATLSCMSAFAAVLFVHSRSYVNAGRVLFCFMFTSCMFAVCGLLERRSSLALQSAFTCAMPVPFMLFDAPSTWFFALLPLIALHAFVLQGVTWSPFWALADGEPDALAAVLPMVPFTVSVLVALFVWVLARENNRSEARLRAEIKDRMQIEQELITQRTIAVQATNAKANFLAMMSHEIRTPLNGVIGMTSLLLDTRLNPEQREFCNTITRSGEALLSVINDVLDFSKIEAGKLHIDSSEFDPEELMEELVAAASFTRDSRETVELLCDCSSDVPRRVIGDSLRVRQVLNNFVSNSQKFTENGFVCVAVSVLDWDEARVVLKFSVADSGIGISPDAMKSLFLPFSQADGITTTRKYGGTGLGLVICKRLVNLMGGEVGVESQPGVGSTFWFTLPLTLPRPTDVPDRPPAWGQQPELPAEEDNTWALQCRNLTVLIVDRSPRHAQMLRNMLSRLNFRVASFADPEDAREAAHRLGGPRVIVLDAKTAAHMNETDLDIAHRWTRVGLPFVLLKRIRSSADPRLQTAEVAYPEGCVPIPTPVRRRALFAAIHSLLQESSLLQAADEYGGFAPAAVNPFDALFAGTALTVRHSTSRDRRSSSSDVQEQNGYAPGRSRSMDAAPRTATRRVPRSNSDELLPPRAPNGRPQAVVASSSADAEPMVSAADWAPYSTSPSASTMMGSFSPAALMGLQSNSGDFATVSGTFSASTHAEFPRPTSEELRLSRRASADDLWHAVAPAGLSASAEHVVSPPAGGGSAFDEESPTPDQLTMSASGADDNGVVANARKRMRSSVQDSGTSDDSAAPPQAKRRTLQSGSSEDVPVAQGSPTDEWLPLVSESTSTAGDRGLKRKLDKSGGDGRRPAVPAPNLRPSIEPPSSMAPPSGTVYRGRVLIAEDNHVNQMVIKRMLKNLNVEHDTCANGREAVEHYKSGQYSMILMDIHMPEMDGFEATSAIREIESLQQSAVPADSRSRIPIVALTASALQPDYERCMAVGMSDFLTKPVRCGEIKTAVDKWLPSSTSTR